MAEKHLNPVMVIIPPKRVDKESSKMPYVVNGVTFDLSSPTHVIRLPQKKPPNVTLRDRLVAMATEGCSHKEVERRRKLKITSAIQELASSLPYKILGRVSHGDVLESAIDHIKKVQGENDELRSRISEEEELRAIVAKLRLENLLLKALHSTVVRPPADSQPMPPTPTTTTLVSQQHPTWTVTSLLAGGDQPKSTPSLLAGGDQPKSTPHTQHISGIMQPWLHPHSTVANQSVAETAPTFSTHRPYYNEGTQWPTQPVDCTSRYISDYQSHDPNVGNYDTYTPSTSAVWRPYSEPRHRLPGLSDIVLPSGNSEHLDQPPQSSSFLVDSLLDDI